MKPVYNVRPKCGDATEGTQGPKGDPGENGIDGIDGTNGIDGVDGTNGIDGTNGTDGVDGTDGADGDRGPRGLNGINGSNGSQGPKGDPGDPGGNFVEQAELLSITTANTIPSLAQAPYNTDAVIVVINGVVYDTLAGSGVAVDLAGNITVSAPAAVNPGDRVVAFYGT